MSLAKSLWGRDWSVRFTCSSTRVTASVPPLSSSESLREQPAPKRAISATNAQARAGLRPATPTGSESILDLRERRFDEHPNSTIFEHRPARTIAGGYPLDSG